MSTVTQLIWPRQDTSNTRDRVAPVGAGHSLKVLVVDDHFLFREALAGLLCEIKSNITVLEAVDGAAALRAVAEQPDISVVILDLGLPGNDGFSVLRRLREACPTISVVAISDRQDRDSALQALALGALGVISKSARRELTLSAMKLILAGGFYIPQEILDHKDTAEKRDYGSTVENTDYKLTGRQLEVLAAMMQGKTNKGICRALNLAMPTVKNHVTAVLKALNVTNRTEAVIAANKNKRRDSPALPMMRACRT